MRFRRKGRKNFHGLTEGVVVDVDDPERRGRIRVRLPATGDTTEPHWARVLQLRDPATGAETFLPEVDDEVLVVFVNGDIRQPVVIGALYNGSDTPPSGSGDD